ETLVRLLACGHGPTEARAAVSLLEYALRGVEVADLAQAVEELRAELERIKHGPGHPQAPADEAAGGSGQAGSGGASPAGPAAGRPEPDSPGGGPAAGPMAGEPATLPFAADVAPLLPPGG